MTWPALMLLASAAAFAADEPAPGETPTKPEPGPKPVEWKWEGAIGPLLSYSPDYAGSATRKISLTPGFYLRYGRVSVSNASGFVTRRNQDDIFRGLGLDVVNDARVRLNLALRLDNGHKSKDSVGLAGVDDVRRTVRMRSSVTWQLEHGFKVAGGWSVDVLGRGGGNLLDFGVSHDRRLSPQTTWGVGVGATWADHRNLQSYYGITPAESAASSYPVYTPGSGLRDVSLGTGWRMEINPRWVALWGGSVGKLLGPAAHSPLTTSTRQWSVNGGIAWRF